MLLIGVTIGIAGYFSVDALRAIFEWLPDIGIAVCISCLLMHVHWARRARTEFAYELAHGYSTAGLLNESFPPDSYSDSIVLVNPFTGHILCCYSFLNSARDQRFRSWYADFILRESEKWLHSNQLPVESLKLPGFKLGYIGSIYLSYIRTSSAPAEWDISPIKNAGDPDFTEAPTLVAIIPDEIISPAVEKKRWVRADVIFRAFTTKHFR
jgi:hypothetical protein